MNRKILLYTVVVLLFSIGLISGCKKIEINPTTTSDVNIVGYLEKYPDSFSLFRQIIERTGYSDFLNAYGAYTCFAPTNSGVKTWLTKIGAASVDAAKLEDLKGMVKFHLLEDTITTGSFKDGKLGIPTMYGQYLITGVGTDSHGSSSYFVNRQAFVSKSNIKVGNGYIHQIDQVLVPATLTLAQELEAKPDYSIFVQAMKETGFYDVLNKVDSDPNKRWMTLMAESNQSLADSGITSYAILKAKYSQLNRPDSTGDSLHMYVAYHILSGIKFLGDIITSPSHETLQPQEVISVQLIDGAVVLNQVEFNGVLEKGVELKRPTSDNAATNGVWHDVKGHFTLKYRKPTAVYWDVATFPEILKLPAYYQKQGYTWKRESEADQPLSEITWGWGSLASTNFMDYYYNASSSNSITGRGAMHFDAIRMPMGLPSRPVWWELLTPPIIKGKYKVWICYIQRKQSSGSNQLCQVSIDGDVLPRTMNFTETRPAGTDAELEAIGWKRYTEGTNSVLAGRFVGVYDFKTTRRYSIRFTPLAGTQNDNYLDMIHFIPINDDQVLPRFQPDGTMIYY